MLRTLIVDSTFAVFMTLASAALATLLMAARLFDLLA